jgi:hypothetical protein
VHSTQAKPKHIQNTPVGKNHRVLKNRCTFFVESELHNPPPEPSENKTTRKRKRKRKHQHHPKRKKMQQKIVKTPDIIGLIVFYTGDTVVLETLRNYMSPGMYNHAYMTKRKILLHAPVQSGKTAEIFKIAQDPMYEDMDKIVVIQNSTLVLQQYMARFKEQGMHDRVHVVDSRDQFRKPHTDIVLMMNNKYRYAHFLKTRSNKKFVLIIDEADQCIQSKHIRAMTEERDATHIYYVTATPKCREFSTPDYFHEIKRLEVAPEYKGLEHLHIQYANTEQDPEAHIGNFVNDQDTGMMLVNAFSKVAMMRSNAMEWSRKYPHLPIVLVTAKKSMFLAGLESKLGKKSVQKIIDAHMHFPKILFIANRLSMRGLSYVSSDYTRHLTHQYSHFKNTTVSNALQKMRLLGKYKDTKPLRLIVPESNYRIIEKMFRALDYEKTCTRYFDIDFE